MVQACGVLVLTVGRSWRPHLFQFCWQRIISRDNLVVVGEAHLRGVLRAGARIARADDLRLQDGSRASALDWQLTIGTTFRDPLKDPKKIVELHIQEDRWEFKIEVASQITVIHLEVQRFIFLVVGKSHTFYFAAAMRA
jgi:hypothetical protein